MSQYITPGAVEGSGGLPSWFSGGEGTPVDTVTPSQKGAVYVDTANGAIYVAAGTTSSDWIVFGVDPQGSGNTPGVAVGSSGGSVAVLGGQRDVQFSGSASLSDAYTFWNGNGDGLSWIGHGVDGEQSLVVQTGHGAHQGTLQDKNGDMSVPGAVTVGGKATVGAGPVDPLDVATKGYVDGRLSAPAQGRYDGFSGLIANGASAPISWVYESGAQLLDLTAPGRPVVLADGMYALSFAVVTGNLTAGGFYNVNVDMEHGAFGLFHGLVVPVAPSTEGCFSATLNMQAGDTISLIIDNGDGVSQRAITMTQAILVKLA